MREGQRFDDVHVVTLKRGRHLLFPEEVDALTRKYICTFRANGAPVSSSMVLVAAQGIVVQHDLSLLKMYGGSIKLRKSWAYSFLKRCGYVKLKATRTATKVPSVFDEVKSAFLQKISELIKASNIAPSMVVKFHQTSCKMVLVSDWTVEVEGSKQVDLISRDNKRDNCSISNFISRRAIGSSGHLCRKTPTISS